MLGSSDEDNKVALVLFMVRELSGRLDVFFLFFCEGGGFFFFFFVLFVLLFLSFFFGICCIILFHEVDSCLYFLVLLGLCE